MLSVNNLSVNYGSTRVVDKLNFELGQDEILMLVGPTGCGKTTILQALAGLIPISEGEMTLGSWHSTAKKHVPPEKRNVGMVFQDFALFPHLTVQQNVCFRLKDTKLADHWLNLLGLDAFRDAKPSRLSGGQKQRVAIARALAANPKLLLADEPTGALDSTTTDSVMDLLKDINNEGMTVFVITHEEEVAEQTKRIVRLKDGLIISDEYTKASKAI